MRTVRLLAACLLVVGGSWVVAGPAQAGNPAFTWHSPTKGQVLSTENVGFHLRVSMPTSDGRLQNDVTVDFAVPQGAAPIDRIVQRAQDQRSIDVTRPLTLRWNGTYSAVARAQGRTNVLDNDTAPRSDSATFTVDAPPATPANLAATVDEESRVVTVSWAPNPEPDLIGYEVEKQATDGQWVHFNATAGTSVVDESTPYAGGTYRYRVAALRRAADSRFANQSTFAEADAEVPNPPPGTPPPPPDGGGGSGGGGTGGQQTGSGSNQTGGGQNGGGPGSGPGGSSGGGSRSGPPLASSGKVDLSDFHSLLAQSQQQQGGRPGAPGEDDGTYDPNLPFGGRNRGGTDEEGEDEAALGGAEGEDATGRMQSLGFLAGGLLATVLAMHVLWIRSEVRRADAADRLLIPEAREPVSAEARFGYREVEPRARRHRPTSVG